jgi:hypothetical protein
MTKTETHWATEAGARVAADRTERLAVRQAEAETAEGRARLPADVLAQRFNETVGLVLEAVDRFASAAAVPIAADPVLPGSVRLAGPEAVDTLWMRRDDDTLVVTFQARSYGDEIPVDLSVEDFAAGAIARRIAEQFCRQLAASEGGVQGLASAASALKRFAQVNVVAIRDELVRERDDLLAEPPPAPTSTLEPAPLTCRCETCTHAAQEEQATRVKHAAWAARVAALDRQLNAMTFGNEQERDDPGQALAELRGELLQAIEINRARPWERVVTYDGRGRPLEAYETTTALGEINRMLSGLYRQAHDVLLFLGADELAKAIEDTRRHMKAALDTPLKQTMPPEEAKRAGTHPARMETDAERAGLRPGPGPNVLEGSSIRFLR